MATPTSMARATPGRFLSAGVTVEIYPSTVRGLSVEVQNATANSTASSVWGSVILPPSSAASLRYTIPLTNSTQLVYVRARHPAQAGYSAGAFTPVISGRPQISPDIQPRILPQLTYQGNVEVPSGADVFVSSSKTIKVGTQPTTGTITKTVRIGVGELVPVDQNVTYGISAVTGDLRPGTAGTASGHCAAVLLPKGATITKGRVRHFRQNNTTADFSVWDLRKVTDTPTVSTLVSFTHATSGWVTTTGTLGTPQVVGAEAYLFSGSLRGNASINNARYLWAEIEYTMPSYSKTV